jgi:hydrogenase-4 component B
VATVIFLLALAGLGIRAGLVPAHFWVSLVHPASPTTTHAFSLGIAIKVAIYLMYRFFFQFLPPQAWWGYLLLAIAVSTALVNVWYAIASHDLKKALAYHSIENIGIITVGIGVAPIFLSLNVQVTVSPECRVMLAGVCGRP